MRILIVMSFLNEEEHLPIALEALAGQTRQPDSLVLVDDGSTDRSAEIASAFAATHEYAKLLHRPKRPPMRDRMLQAHEVQAFQWGLGQLDEEWDVVAKFDADIQLTNGALAELERRLQDDPSIGIAGFKLSRIEPDGRRVLERCPDWHARGPTKFYRRQCWEAIAPLPPIVGWETTDEARARMLGWRTVGFRAASGDPVHLRRTGSYDGVLRGYRRAGLAAYAYGAHPLHVCAAGASRLADPPRVLCGLNYLLGWAMAGIRRVPRAEPAARAFTRREDLRRLRGRVSLRSARRDAARHFA
jgi:poly-beta-1,6-N-acetyl-D-glucosamine synthase